MRVFQVNSLMIPSPIVALIVTGVLAPAANPPQQGIGFGEGVQLPSFTGAADHATVAANHRGDVCAAYQTEIAGNRHQVEVTIAQWLAPGQWNSGGSLHFLLGDAGLDRFGFGDDNCHKPDVTALEDGSFLVAWPRFSQSHRELGRIEGTRIYVRDSGGVLLPAPILEEAGPGEGHVLVAAVNSGDAGVMPDLAPSAGDVVVLAYADEESVTIGANGDFYREYSVRLLRMDWAIGPSGPGFTTGPWTVATGVPMDNEWWNPYFGGLILPDVVLDDLDNVVVAWERFELAGHPGGGGSDYGEIVVQRVESLSSATPLTLLDETRFVAANPERTQRRPNLATSHADAVNHVLVSWADFFDWPQHDRVEFQEIQYPSTNDVGLALPQPRYWQANAQRDEGRPVPLLLPGRPHCFADRSYSTGRELPAASDATQRMVRLPKAIQWPLRPAVASAATPDPLGGIVDTLFLTYEGADVNDPDAFRTYLAIYRL